MTIDPQTSADAASSNPSQPAPASKRRAGKWALAAVLIAATLGVTGIFASQAFSAGPMFGHWHGGGGFMRGGSPAQIGDRADRMVRHLAIEVDATAEQQERLRTIVRSAVNDLLPTREKFLAARQQGRDLLTQPNINRAEIERLRAEQVALADSVSKRLTQALADAAEVLTPEQRRKLNDMLPPQGFGRGWRRG